MHTKVYFVPTAGTAVGKMALALESWGGIFRGGYSIEVIEDILA